MSNSKEIGKMQYITQGNVVLGSYLKAYSQSVITDKGNFHNVTLYVKSK